MLSGNSAKFANLASLCGSLGLLLMAVGIFSAAATFAQFGAGLIVLAMGGALGWMFFEGLTTVRDSYCRGGIYRHAAEPFACVAVAAGALVSLALLHFAMIGAVVVMLTITSLGARGMLPMGTRTTK